MFKIQSSRYLEEYKGTGTLFIHDVTKMEVYHLKTDSSELSCAFMFSTPSRDDTGVAHILEHTVLCGSKRFPVKDPFTQVYLSSPNTFLNAMTYTDKTVYPFASPLKKDFDILFDIYSDAVFDPLLRRQSFEQEGVRFFDNKVDGVVFNEMSGASSSEDSFVSNYCMRDLFEGTPAKYISGGDPVSIADLTYEEYLRRYKSWYSPSNCRLFLFGDLDPKEYLDKLEERYLFNDNLSKWDNVKLVSSSDKYTGGQYKPIRRNVKCPVDKASSVVMTWLLNSPADSFNCLALNILVDILLGDPGAPLYKAAVESPLGQDLNAMSGTDVDLPLMPFIYGFTGAKKNKEDEIEKFIMGELDKIVNNGLDPDQVRAAIKRQEFKLKEIQGGELPYGLVVGLKSSKTWLRGRTVEDGILVKETLEQLKREVEKGPFFESWIKKNLIENPRRCLLSLSYDKDYTKNLKKILDEKAGKRQGTSDKKAYEDFVAKEDSKEDLETIQRIRISDMPSSIPSYDMKKESFLKSCLYRYPQQTNGIVYLNMGFDVLSIDLEEKKYLPLLVRLMQMCPTDRYSYEKVSNLVKLFTGGFSISLNNGTDQDKNPKSLVFVKTKMLFEDISSATDLIGDILLKSDFSDKERIKAAISDLCIDFQTDYLDEAHRFSMTYASSLLSPSLLESEVTSGTTCFLNMEKLLKSTDEELTKLSSVLTSLRDKIFTQRNLTIQVSTDEENIESAVNTVGKMICILPEGFVTKPASFYFEERKTENSHLFVSVSSGPAYNALVCPLEDQSQKKLISKLLFASAIGNGKLWDTVRGKNGAYGVFSMVNIRDNLFMAASYRDPMIEETFKAFREVLETEVTSDEIEYVIVNIIGKELKPLSPQLKSMEAFRRALYSMTDSVYRERRKAMLEVTKEDVSQAGEELFKAVEKCCIKATVCGRQMVPKSEEKNCLRVCV